MTAFDITIEHIYSILRDAAREYPADDNGMKCKQLQTFRVLQTDRGGELGAENMGATYADRNTVYFFSRAWDRQRQNPNKITAEFPALTAFEIQSEIVRGAFQPGSKRNYLIELAVMDVYREDCQTKTGCEARSINQIYADTETLLNSVMVYLSGAVIAYTSQNQTPDIYNQSHLDWMVDNGRIAWYELVAEIGASIAGANKDGIQVRKVEMPAQNLYGNRIVFTTPLLNCNSVSFSKSYPEIIPVSHEEGCRDCG